MLIAAGWGQSAAPMHTFGTPAILRCVLSSAHTSGEIETQAMGKLARSLATDKVTATWQLS